MEFHTAFSQSTNNSDFDLLMASRDRNQHVSSMRNGAYRQAMSELAGELYLHTYTQAFQEELKKKRNLWSVHASSTKGQGKLQSK